MKRWHEAKNIEREFDNADKVLVFNIKTHSIPVKGQVKVIGTM